MSEWLHVCGRHQLLQVPVSTVIHRWVMTYKYTFMPKLKDVFYAPPFEEWWRGIKCYPCPWVRPSVRPSVIKIWCPLNNFWKTANLVCWYIISKPRSSLIWVILKCVLQRMWTQIRASVTILSVSLARHRLCKCLTK